MGTKKWSANLIACDKEYTTTRAIRHRAKRSQKTGPFLNGYEPNWQLFTETPHYYRKCRFAGNAASVAKNVSGKKVNLLRNRDGPRPKHVLEEVLESRECLASLSFGSSER